MRDFEWQDDPQPSARELGAGRFSDRVLAALDKCLELDPKDRPADCGELLGLLRLPLSEDLVESQLADDGEGENRRKESGSGGKVGPPSKYGIDKRSRTRELAEQGDAEAQCQLGDWYYWGIYVPKDVALMIEWYSKASEQGNAEAQFALGEMDDGGEGVPQDNVLAMRWYRKAAEQGCAEGQRRLGDMYHSGEGVPVDVALAERWYRKAAEQGDAEAQDALQEMGID